MRITVIGRGRVGQGLRDGLRGAGYRVELVRGRGPAPRLRGCDVCILAVPDASICEVAASLRATLPPGAVVAHCAGSRPVDDLASLEGHPRAVMHPLVSFPRRGGAPPFSGTTFVLRGDRAARRALKPMVRALGAHPLESEVAGPAYHAAAAMLANGAAALAWSGVGVLTSLGMPPRSAARALGGLLQTVGHNVAKVGVPDALSGPILRGDVSTVGSHRKSLAPEARRHYDAIAPVIIDCAVDAGLDATTAAALRRALRGPGRS